MRLSAPAFWFRPPGRPGLAARLLAPLGALWALGAARRAARPPRWRAPVPVICLGNVTVGGAGKTPAAILLLERLAARGAAPHAVSRGHGGAAGKGPPHRVDLARDRAEAVGDEPLLLAAHAQAWVGRDRAETAEAAVAAGAGALVLDDGLQDPGLARSLTLLVVDAETGFGNGRCLPAGPLREPPGAGLARADAVLLIGPPAARDRMRPTLPDLGGRPLLEGEVRPKPVGIDWRAERVVAFAGIARPEKLFATLRGLGAEVVAAHGFADHAPLTPRVLRRLAAEAERADARLVTTEKDAVRLPPAFRGVAMPLPVALTLSDPAALEALLDPLFAPPGGASAEAASRERP